MLFCTQKESTRELKFFLKVSSVCCTLCLWEQKRKQNLRNIIAAFFTSALSAFLYLNSWDIPKPLLLNYYIRLTHFSTLGRGSFIMPFFYCLSFWKLNFSNFDQNIVRERRCSSAAVPKNCQTLFIIYSPEFNNNPLFIFFCWKASKFSKNEQK